jgi:hypothetical protein
LATADDETNDETNDENCFDRDHSVAVDGLVPKTRVLTYEVEGASGEAGFWLLHSSESYRVVLVAALDADVVGAVGIDENGGWAEGALDTGNAVVPAATFAAVQTWVGIETAWKWMVEV